MSMVVVRDDVVTHEQIGILRRVRRRLQDRLLVRLVGRLELKIGMVIAFWKRDNDQYLHN